MRYFRAFLAQASLEKPTKTRKRFFPVVKTTPGGQCLLMQPQVLQRYALDRLYQSSPAYYALVMLSSRRTSVLDNW
jgi:hypothetical protein